MFRLLIPCLIWLSSVRSDNTYMPDDMMKDKEAMKRESYYNPCPPTFAHSIPYSSPTQIYVKPYPQPVPIEHAPKPIVTYVKPAPPPAVEKPLPLFIKPIVQPKAVHAIQQKPMLSYAPTYQKFMYNSPLMYEKFIYQIPKTYVKKYELPTTEVIQKPSVAYSAHYSIPKVVQVPMPQVNYVNLAHSMVHPQMLYHFAAKSYCP